MEHVRIFDTGPILPVGAAGAAVATAIVGPIDGEILAVYIDNDPGQAATLDTVIQTQNVPVQPILSLTGVKASGWYYPRVSENTILGAASTDDGTHPFMCEIPLNDNVAISWSAANPNLPVRVFVVAKAL